VCQGCDVQTQCLQWALSNGVDYGVWGGLSEDQRRLMKRRTARNRKHVGPLIWGEVLFEVIAVDGQDRPAMLRYTTGQGAMVPATYPFEHFATYTPFVNPEPTWRLYDALATEAGIDRPVTVADQRVAAAELLHEDFV